MCIYLIVDVILLIFCWIYNCHKKGTLFFSCFIFFCLMVAHNGQFNMMCDYTNYMNLFLGKASIYGNINTSSGYDLEMPFYYFLKFLRIFPIIPFIYILAIGIMFCTPLFFLIKKESNNPPLSLFYLMVLNNASLYLFFFSAHRQMLATVFLLWAYIIYKYARSKYKNIITILFVLLGLFSHSSSYFVIPIALMLYFIKLPTKKYLYIIVAISLILGLFFRNLIAEHFSNFLILFGDNENVARSTHYLFDDVFGDQKTYEFTALPPMALLIIFFIYHYKKMELQQYTVKCWICAFILYLSLSSIPLINRAVLLFFLLGIVGGIPLSIRKLNVKKQFLVVSLLFLYIAYRAYNRPEYILLPYKFFFE